MGRNQRLALAGLGLVGLVGWYATGLVLDVRLFHGLQDTVVAGPLTIFWALRIGLPFLAVAFACVALVQTIRDRPVRGWFIAVLVVLFGPILLRGLPLRPGYLPYYLFSALYLVLAMTAPNPGRKT
jgi:hypothetical protein